jgi:hypothetical protein
MSDGGFCHYCQKVNCICAKSEYLLGFEACREQAAKLCDESSVDARQRHEKASDPILVDMASGREFAADELGVLIRALKPERG